MNRKGFTLIEVLAVIAILAILIVFVSPKIISSYQNAKKNSFVVEAQNVYKATKAQIVSNYINGLSALIYDSKHNKLNIESKNLNYIVEVENNLVKSICVDNNEYKIELESIKQIDDINVSLIESGACETVPEWYEKCDNNSTDLKCKILKAETPYADNQKSQYVASTSGINFSEISSDANGKGLYYTTDKTKTMGGERVYYYRGAVTNNYALYGGFCWRIVRTNEDGSIKLRYNGAYAGGCLQTGTATGGGRYIDINNGTKYSYNSADNSYYGTSIIKGLADSWYSSRLNSSYSYLIADTPYCNDRSSITFNRITAANPSYVCPLDNYKFTVSNTIGNGLLTYPIGFLTADEMSFAGGIKYSSGNSATNNYTYYLYTSEWYWSMTRYSSVAMFGLGSLGGVSNDVMTGTSLVIPVISLKSSAQVTSGTGVYNNPYIIN